MNKRKIFLLIVSIFVLLLITFFIEFKRTNFFNKKPSYGVEKIISTKDLLDGDIIFWKLRGPDNRAGHVAVVTTASDIAKNIRISHATDHPNYNAFVETYLQPTKKVEKQKRYYYVIRV
ncbi:MAG TPA: CHAP domain-containing protein [Gammaproteobacteria bacterium]|nr:CHAP domain-containing protein [Gammaproteobacteria bacterium]